MSSRTDQTDNDMFETHKFRIVSIDHSPLWDQVTNYGVKLENTKTNETINISSLNYGALHEYITDSDPDSIDTHIGDTIVGVVINNSVHTFCQNDSDRLEDIKCLLQSAQIKRKR